MAGNPRFHVVTTPRRRKNKKIIIATIATVVVFTVVAVLIVVWVVLPLLKKPTISLVDTGSVKSEGIYRKIRHGVLEGSQERAVDGTTIYTFKGIPFAKPPVDNRRWKPAEPLPPDAPYWTGIRKANEYGSSCAQLNKLRNRVGSEDCLYLNVWTPAFNSSRNLPVLVYIHGGALTVGSGERPGFQDLARAGIVGVSINYRLNAFGFLTLDVLSRRPGQNITSNYGFVDQIEALKWVRQNIRQFGGNPDRVCIMGFSAGGKSTQALLSSPLALDLFHSAIMMSAPTVYHVKQSKAEQDNQVFVTRAGCARSTDADTLACLYAIDTDQVLKSIPWQDYPSWSYDAYLNLPKKGTLSGALAVIDDIVIPRSPVDLASMKYQPKQKIPILFGSAAQEAENSRLQVENLTTHALVQFLNASLWSFGGSLTDDVVKVYDVKSHNTSLDLLLATIATDVRMNCQSEIYLRNASRSPYHTFYRYLVTNRPSIPLQEGNACCLRFAFHGWDVDALFNFPAFASVSGRPTPSEQKFANDLQSDVISFIRTGKPADKAWLPYSGSYLEYGNGFSRALSGKLYHEEECRVLMEAGLYEYGWML